MSGRLWKWLLVAFVILVALYAAYPPVRVRLVHTRVVERVAATPEDAEAHKVEVGETYVVEQTQEPSVGLPLARGEKSRETGITWRQEDLSVVREESLYAQGRVKLGLDMAGGTELLCELKPKSGQALSGKVADTIKILRQRIDPQDVKEFRIQGVGQNRILIQVPRASRGEVERLKDRLVRMGMLEFKLAMPRGDPKFQAEYDKAEQGQPVPGYEKLYLHGDKTKPFYLVREGEAAITGDYLAYVGIRRDDRGRPAVRFTFDARGRRKFASITEGNRGWLLAIILDGTLKSAPLIEEPIAGPGIIRGDFTHEEVRDLVTILQAGSLPVDIEILQESTVGPELGRDSIRRGLQSVAIAGLLVLLFIGLYYLACGLVADGALVLNLVLLMGVLGLLGAALTLPGVAGVLLTIGMAVDANVLIFERIREEAAAGKPNHIALRNGYEKAYTTIVDANVTTLLTAIILYLVGTGPVRGFAVTLSAGLVLSMFTALFVTRLILESLLAKGWLKGFRMRSVISRPSLAYSRWRRRAFLVSGGVVAVGMIAFFGRGPDLYDVDFTGGSLARLSLGQAVSLGEVRRRLEEGGFPRAQVQGLRAPGAQGDKSTDFRIRIKGLGGRTLEQGWLAELEGRLKEAELLTSGRIVVSPDGRSLEVKLAKPVGERELRTALAGEDGDPFDLHNVRDVVPGGDVKGQKFLLRLMEVPPLAELPDLWHGMLRVLALANVKREACSLRVGEVEGGSAPEDLARLELQTGRKVQWQLLAAEFVKRGFRRVQIEQKAEPAQRFQLSGQRDVLMRFKREMPAEVSLPAAWIDDLSVTAELQEPFKEEDLRAFAEKEGVGEVAIVALDAESSRYSMTLGYEETKEKLRAIFGDLGARHVGVQFSPLEGEDPDPEGYSRVQMVLSEPLLVPEIKYYLEQAKLRSVAQGMSVDKRLQRIVRETNKGRWDNVRTDTVTLRVPAKDKDEAERLITKAFGETDPVGEIESIGSVVAKEMQGRALLAVVCASMVIVFYVAVRFHALQFGVAAVIALIHDVMITAGLLALADWSGALGDMKINLPMLAAFLTILGYSLNDTIVVFDRIRENMVQSGRKTVSADVIDASVNQVLNRTILTSLTTLMVVVVLYLMGGAVLQGLAFTLIVGVVVGTYSSVFIASPVLLDWAHIVRGTRTFFRLLFLPVRAPFMVGRVLRGAGGKQAGRAR